MVATVACSSVGHASKWASLFARKCGNPATHGAKPFADIRLVHNAQNRNVFCDSAISEPAGMPEINARVPSIGSITKKTHRPKKGLFVVKLFAQNAVIGKLLRNQRAWRLRHCGRHRSGVEPAVAQLVVNFYCGAEATVSSAAASASR